MSNELRASAVTCMIENRNIVCFGSSWYIDPTSKHQVMKRLATRNNVIWVNYHASRRPRINPTDLKLVVQKLRESAKTAHHVSESLRVLTPLLIPLPGSRLARRVNRSLLHRRILRALATCDPAPVQVWTFAPDISFLPGSLAEEILVYYCVDEFSEFPGYDAKRIRAQEADLLRRADLVITTSQSLHDSKSAFNSNTHLVRHGVDHQHFGRALDPALPVSAELSSIPKPILGFFGLIQDCVDLELLASVARNRPDWSIVLIGDPVCDVSVLRGIRNVHQLGRRPYAELPSYAKGFDVALIPFRINELTRHVNPIKLREYLSAGVPVVSTPLPEVEQYRGLVEIADAGKFVEACGRALQRGAADQRAALSRAMAAELWDSKIDLLSMLVESTISTRRGVVAG